MPELEEFRGQNPAWCPGCGNLQILRTFKLAMVALGIEPHEITIVSGIGQAGKFPHYTRCNTFNGLHGRTLPVAQAIHLVNHEMRVLAVAGDGDCYGEGGNHFLHAMRRNLNITLFVHDNQVYGLTKGQASPTTSEGTVTGTQPFGVLYEPLNPMALAVAMDCSFVARGFSGNQEQLQKLMQAALEHKGFALLDILQNCPSYNKINTMQWYKERCYPVGPDHDPSDREAAFRVALEFGDRIPTGVIYRHPRHTLEEAMPEIANREPLVRQPFSQEDVAGETERYY
ncbi:MAG: thiamine pyrophosphate-dependent enzyme [Thermoleophilia bacterium]|nr:thiamine pyrophosphate-dependent enzyme [Thermoleophilia bacterium]